MRQRLDITDVEAHTKIRAKYLRALENEDFGMLPGSTFVKSFLRTYAEFLGLDPHILVEEYRMRHDPRDESELTPFARPRGRDRRPPPRRPGPWLGVVLAVGGILALLLILGLTGGGSSDETSKSTTTTTTAKKKTKPKPKPAPRAKPVPRTVKLRIVPAGPTYVCVDKGAGTPVVYQNTLTGPRSFTAKHLRLNLGRRAVTLTSNGRRVRIPPGSEPIGYDFRPTRYRTIPAGQKRPCG
jgi:helix-turn-helix protein